MNARKMKWAGNVKLMGKNINACRLFLGKQKAETYLEGLDVDTAECDLSNRKSGPGVDWSYCGR
jgi:hypothetical protein